VQFGSAAQSLRHPVDLCPRVVEQAGPNLLGFAWSEADGMTPPIPEIRVPAGGVMPPRTKGPGCADHLGSPGLLCVSRLPPGGGPPACLSQFGEA
jgi:hypothetical protein